MNIRHDIDPALVVAQIERKIVRHEQRRIHSKLMQAETLAAYLQDKAAGKEKRWAKPPSDGSYIDPMYDEWIEKERTYFAKVRVIELPHPPYTILDNRFILVYGDEDDTTVKSGTGPFPTFEEAAEWFLRGGR